MAIDFAGGGRRKRSKVDPGGEKEDELKMKTNWNRKRARPRKTHRWKSTTTDQEIIRKECKGKEDKMKAKESFYVEVSATA